MRTCDVDAEARAAHDGRRSRFVLRSRFCPIGAGRQHVKSDREKQPTQALSASWNRIRRLILPLWAKRLERFVDLQQLVFTGGQLVDELGVQRQASKVSAAVFGVQETQIRLVH